MHKQQSVKLSETDEQTTKETRGSNNRHIFNRTLRNSIGYLNK